MSDEHANRLVGQPNPAVAARIVGDLLVDQTGDQGGEQVQVPLFTDTDGSELLAGVAQCGDRRRVRLRRRSEARDRMLEQQLVAGDVRGAELEETVHAHQ